jgi:hypothetical protein
VNHFLWGMMTMLSEAELQKKYGISQQQWQELYDKQNGRCAICNCVQRYQALATDHCHKTGIVRGLLCVQCNRGLGRFFDSPIRLRKAAEYIERSRRGQMSAAAPSTVAGESTSSLAAHSLSREELAAQAKIKEAQGFA